MENIQLKLEECQFYLSQFEKAGIENKWFYYSAFVVFSISVYDALRGSFDKSEYVDIHNFICGLNENRKVNKKYQLYREIRNKLVHPSKQNHRPRYDFWNPTDEDLSSQVLSRLQNKTDINYTNLVSDCYDLMRFNVELISLVYKAFPTILDPFEYYSYDNYIIKNGKTIEDLEEEFGYPRGWTKLGDDDSDIMRFQMLVSGAIQDPFRDYFERYIQPNKNAESKS